MKKKNKELLTRLDQSNVLDWKVSSILFKTKFIIWAASRKKGP